MSIIATAEVVLVLRSLGIAAEVTADPDAIELDDGPRVHIIERPTPSLAGVQALVAQHTGACLLVTNEVRRAYRQILSAAGWGWLDRRGHLHLPAAGISQSIDELLGPAPQTPDLWRRHRVMAVALALLRLEGPAPASRDLRYYAGISAASAATALAELRTLGLIDTHGLPDREALARQLASRWQPRWFGLATTPSRHGLDPLLTEVLRFGLDHLAAAGWAQLEPDSLAPAETDVSRGREPRFYLPDRRALHWALTSFGRAEPSAAITWLAVPPTPIATWYRNPSSHPHAWPTADAVVLDLHLASREEAQTHQLATNVTKARDPRGDAGAPGEGGDQPVERGGELAEPLVVARLAGQIRETAR